MTDRIDALKELTDEELVAEFRRLKTETAGADPSLTPPDDSTAALRHEMDRRGIAPDREDVIPDEGSPTEEPVVDDHA